MFLYALHLITTGHVWHTAMPRAQASTFAAQFQSLCQLHGQNSATQWTTTSNWSTVKAVCVLPGHVYPW